MTFTFKFDEREERNLEILNCAIQAMPLTSLDTKEVDGYLATTKRYDMEGEMLDISYRYGFDTVTFSAEYEEEKEPEYYRVDTAAYEKGLVPKTEKFRERWLEENPGRRLRMITQYGFDIADVYLVLSSVKQLQCVREEMADER